MHYKTILNTSKKKIQKYLAGEREGFSLVELIIVIAIMAILIGVIALAVIPNIQKSRESKDLSALDSVLSGLNVTCANVTPASGDLSGKVEDLLKTTNTSDFAKEAQVNLGNTVEKSSSSAAQVSGSSADMYYGINIPTTGGKATIYVWYGNAITGDVTEASVKSAASDRNYSKETDAKFGDDFAVMN